MKKVFALAVTALLLLCVQVMCYAQHRYLRHFTTQDGLPSNVVYNIYADRQGFLWFCTDQGISAFNGQTFINYNINNGLPDNEVFGMQEDHLGRHWFLCYNKKPAYYKNGKIYTSKNDILCRIVEQSNINYHALISSNTSDWLTFERSIFKGFNNKTSRYIINKLPESGGQSYFELDGCSYFIYGGIFRAQCGDQYREDTIAPMSVFTRDRYHDRLFQAGGLPLSDTLYSYTIHKGHLKLNRRDAIPGYCYTIKCINIKYLLCISSSGIYIYDVRRGAFLPYSRYAVSGTINRITRDYEGNTWLSTLNNGAYVESRRSAYLYDQLTGLPESEVINVCIQDSTSIIGCYDGGLFGLVRNNTAKIYSSSQSSEINRVKFAYRLRDGSFIAGGDRGLFRIHGQSGKIDALSPSAQKDCFRLRDAYYMADADGGSCYDDNTGAWSRLWDQRSTSVATLDGKSIWYGTLKGIYHWQNGISTKFEQDTLLSDTRIIRLAYVRAGCLAIATHQSGIYLWDGRALRHIDRTAGIASDNCAALCTDGLGTLWVASERGLDRLTLDDSGGYAIYHYSEADGIPDEKINDIAYDHDRLYMATAKGIIVRDRAKAPARVSDPPHIYINSLAFKDSIINWPSGTIVLPHNKNTIQISYTSVFLSAGAGLQYRYFLEGGGTDTMLSKSTAITISSLKPGDYRMLIWVRQEASGTWSKNPAVLSLTMLPPFWLRPWFVFLCIASGVCVVYMLHTLRVRIVRNRALKTSHQKQQMAVLKLQALRSQINPHFMFNALNSIQHFYTQKDDLRANEYMDLFAQLIRKALNHSEQHWIKLSEEMDMLTNYIALEQMRFRNAFTFDIIVDPAIDAQKLMIPSMLLQPYIENAIGHGLRALQHRQGLLLICFNVQENCLVCSINDNGVGIKATLRYQEPGRTSFGMDLIRQRIDTLNALYQTRIQVSVSDKSDLEPALQGTIITIMIPIKNYHE